MWRTRKNDGPGNMSPEQWISIGFAEAHRRAILQAPKTNHTSMQSACLRDRQGARRATSRSQEPSERSKCTTAKLLLLPKPRPKMPRNESRLSTSRYEFGVSCIIQRPPPRPGSCPLEGGRTPASEGGSAVDACKTRQIRTQKSNAASQSWM